MALLCFYMHKLGRTVIELNFLEGRAHGLDSRHYWKQGAAVPFQCYMDQTLPIAFVTVPRIAYRKGIDATGWLTFQA
jgi:hypothetical protein